MDAHGDSPAAAASEDLPEESDECPETKEGANPLHELTNKDGMLYTPVGPICSTCYRSGKVIHLTEQLEKAHPHVKLWQCRSCQGHYWTIRDSDS